MPDTGDLVRSSAPRVRSLALVSAAALLLAACGADEPDPDTAPADDAAQDDLAQPEDLLGDDLPDPNELVVDGQFRGEGVILPAIDGWHFDEMAYAQGVALASSEDGLEQMAGEAIDTADLPEELTFEELVEANLTQLPSEPTTDDEVEIDGAVQARALRFDDLPSQQEDAPTTSLLVIFADDGEGQLAVFNYAAGEDDYDEATADALVSGAGFDPDSDPTPAPPMPDLEDLEDLDDLDDLDDLEGDDS